MNESLCVWEPMMNETVQFVDIYGNVDEMEYTGTREQKELYAIGNLFREGDQNAQLAAAVVRKLFEACSEVRFEQ